MSRDHKPELEVERERILRAGGFIHGGRINGSLNLARAIGELQYRKEKLWIDLLQFRQTYLLLL